MNDPYKVLGVSPSASDAEIKQAYRELVKKYHPDNYAGSPLADLAGEKMSEINAAYDAVQNLRRGGGSSHSQQDSGYNPYGSGSGSGYGYGQRQQAYSGQFGDIRRMIQMGRTFDAEELLNGVPTASRDAEWYFLKGTVFYKRGFLDNALSCLQTAVQIDPQNPEYQSALNAVLRQRQYGFGGQPQASYHSCSPCDICGALICADCACDTFRCCCS